MRELVGGKNTISRTVAVLKKSHKVTFNFNFLIKENIMKRPIYIYT